MYEASLRQRTLSALASLAIVSVGGAALVLGLAAGAPMVSSVAETFVALTPMPTQVPPPPRPEHTPKPTPTQAAKAQAPRPKDKASPENLRNRASAVFAPVLPPLSPPPPIVAAAKPDLGSASNTGASDRVGPGQGAGGQGDGNGGGGQGGDGDGWGDAVTRPVQTRGKLYWSDLPAAMRETHRGGELELRYQVNIDGQVSDCHVTQSSGSPQLDAQTCRLITQRFRFRPSRDAAGRPVPSGIIEKHGWEPSPADVANEPEG